MISYRRSERGQMIVIVAVALTALVAMAGLVIDGGMALSNRRQAQNAADAAAIAGTRVLSLDLKSRSTGQGPVSFDGMGADAAVCAAINSALQYNDTSNQAMLHVGCDQPGGSSDAVYINASFNPIGNVGAGIPVGATGVRVVGTGQSDTLLMSVIGISTINVAADATAVTGPVPPPIGALLPIVVQNPLGPFVPGQQYALRTDSEGQCDVAVTPVNEQLAQASEDAGIVLAMATSTERAPSVLAASKPRVPVATPGSQTFGASISVQLTADPGNTIWYTTDGTTPQKGKGASAPAGGVTLTFTKTTVLQAIAVGSTGPSSDVGSFTYTQTAPPGAVTANPVSGTTFATSITVTLVTPTSGAAIRYTTNGSSPTVSSPLYTGPLTFTASTQLKAIAVTAGVASEVSTFNYPKDGETQPPLPNHPDGTTFESGITITLQSATPGVTIYYTKDGSTPTTSSLVYNPTWGIVLTDTTTIRAFATVAGADSVEVSYMYELQGYSCPDLSAGNYGWVDFNGGSSSNAQLKDWLANPGTAPTSWYYRTCTGPGDVNCREVHDPTDPAGDHWLLAGTSGHRQVSLELACTEYLGQDVYVPIWDRFETVKKNSNGHNAVFHLIGFAVFTMDGVIDNKASGDPDASKACGDGLNFGGTKNDKGLVGTYKSALIGSQVQPCIPSPDGTIPCAGAYGEFGINLAE